MSSGTFPPAAATPLTLPTPLVPSLVEPIGAGGATHDLRRGRLPSLVGDVVGVLAVAYLFPVAILAVGVPIALAVRLLAWALGWIVGAL